MSIFSADGVKSFPFYGKPFFFSHTNTKPRRKLDGKGKRRERKRKFDDK
jgi:hypothetical protein